MRQIPSLTQVGVRTNFLSMGQLPELMTVAEVAEALRLTDETIHRWAREGRLEYVNVLGVKRFHRAYIERLVSGQAEIDNFGRPVGAA